jgi:hypothetical protein
MSRQNEQAKYRKGALLQTLFALRSQQGILSPSRRLTPLPAPEARASHDSLMVSL